MTDEQRIHYLAGQIHALTAFAGAVVKTHPNPDALRGEHGRLYQVALAMSESRLVSEDYMDGLRAQHDSLQAF